ncbi:hypothetical protein M3Y97_00312800 [Aphelenchoides bicaudatus]|nr:hypothetical protein M3Y97_00312800 [Aphelenchoides bicaudatus]
MFRISTKSSIKIMAENGTVDYEIVKAKAEDAPEVLEFMLKDFLYKEPLNIALDLKLEEAREFFSEIVDAGLSCPVNYVVRGKDGKIIAIRWACIVNRNEAENDYTFESSVDNWKTWQVAPKDIDCFLSWLIISVDEAYTRRGIAKKLLTYRLEELKEVGCQGLITTASAYNSQQLFQKMGYDELFAIQHKDWKNKDGEQVFKCQDQTRKVALVMKRL